MEPASVIDTVALQDKAKEQSANFQQKLTEILDDPKKTLYAMLALAAAIALVFVIFVTISQIFSASSQVTKSRSKTQGNSLLTERKDDSKQLDSQRKQDIDQIAQTIKNYQLQNSHYPPSISILIPDYLPVAVVDPQSHQEYNYQPSIDLQSYTLWSVLSDGKEYRVDGP